VQKFGFLQNQEQAALSIQYSDRYELIIDTSQGNPTELARQLSEKLKDSKKLDFKPF
jgi:chloramphenicol 3-O-phosphotransferase